MPKEIWTIGHSSRDLETFLGLLAASAIGRIVDVRRFPGSRRLPQFRRDTLRAELQRAGIDYTHIERLGGRRTGRAPGSPNTGWRVEAFNAYADYMDTPEFAGGLAELIAAAEASRVAVMCAEAVPWRCHRRLIADALIVRGWVVSDIIGPDRVVRHELTDFARVEEGRLTYPAHPLFPPDY